MGHRELTAVLLLVPLHNKAVATVLDGKCRVALVGVD